MSIEQAAAFAEGLVVITDKFKVDAQARTDEYTGGLEDVTQEFVDASHDYAKDMTDLAVKLTEDVKTLYDTTYPEGVPDVGDPDGGETPPPEGGTPPDWNTGPDDPHVSTGPVGPQPKK